MTTRHQWGSHIVGWRSSYYSGPIGKKGVKKTARFQYRCQRCNTTLPEGTSPLPWWATVTDGNCEEKKERDGDEG